MSRGGLAGRAARRRSHRYFFTAAEDFCAHDVIHPRILSRVVVGECEALFRFRHCGGVSRVCDHDRDHGYGREGGEGVFIRCCHLTFFHAFLSTRSTVPTTNRDTSNIWVLITFVPSFLFFRTLVLSSFWTSRGHRRCLFFPPVLASNLYHA